MWRLQADLRLLQLDRAQLELSGPAGDALREHRDAWMAGELRGLSGRGGPDAVATVVEDEPLLPGDAVPPEPALDLDRELAQRLRVGERRGRAEHERDRAGHVAALVRVRAAAVAEHEIRLAEALPHPLGVDDGRKLRPAL
jgi:hypothetical protein